MLNDPNTSSPANVSASVQFRTNPEAFKNKVSDLVKISKELLPTYVDFHHHKVSSEEEYVEEFDYYEDDFDELDGEEFSDSGYSENSVSE